MTELSPQQQSRQERGSNRQAFALFTAAAAVLTVGGLLILSESKDGDIGNDQPQGKNASPTRSDKSRRMSESGIDWQVQLQLLREGLPQQQLPYVTDLSQELRQLESDATATQRLFDRDAQLAALVKREVPIPQEGDAWLPSPVVLQDWDAKQPLQQLRADPDRLRDAAEQEIIEAEQEAVEHLRKQAAPALRKLTTDLREHQDEVSRLRELIAKADRQQTKQHEKAARAKALEAEMADVQKYLRTFTSPGYLQPEEGDSPWNTVRTIDSQPVSLLALKKAGALERTKQGLERLYIFGGGRNPGLNNRRPLGEFPEYFANGLANNEKRRIVERAQQLLREHGQALVEAQMLAK